MFPRMAEILTPRTQGVARIDHYTVSELESKMSAFRPGAYCPKGTYARLLVGHSLMMSDTNMERRTNYQIVSEAAGDVLIAGLGIGMILHPIFAKDEVRSVTVIEKYQDVIDLVQPTLPSNKLTIVCADIREWQPAKGTHFDTIYFDIWPDICTDNLPQINLLHRRFRKFLAKHNQAWMGSWQHDELKRLKRRGR